MFGVSVSIIANTYRRAKLACGIKKFPKKNKSSAKVVKSHDAILPKAHLSEKAKDIRTKIKKLIREEEYSESNFSCTTCSLAFVKLHLNEFTFSICITCKTIAFEQGELQKLTGLNKDIPCEDQSIRISAEKCPACDLASKECLFSRKPPIPLNKCVECKLVFFKSSYLNYILRYV